MTERNKKMKKLTASALSLVLLLAVTGCGKGREASSPKNVENVAVNVSVVEAQKTAIEDTVTYTGEIKASESTSVSAKASGTARVVYSEIGDYVNEGDILLQIDDTDYRTQYNQANAAYQSALAQYNSVTNGTAQQTKLQLESALNAAKIEYNNAKTNYENQKVLYDSGAISKTAYDGAVTRYENAQLNLNTAQSNYDLTVDVVLAESKASAKAALNSASVAVEAAQNALNNTVVRAPISGYIASRNANKGQMVSPGVEIFSIKSTQSIDANINVTESIIPNITVGTKAIVSVKAAGAENIEGTVSNVSPVKDAKTGMYAVSVAIDNVDGLINDGMFADITLTLKDSADALVIPSEAILEDEDGAKYVYVANGDNAKRADVTVGIITDEYTEIISGISEGDNIVVSGKDYLSDKNNKIKVVE